MWSGILGNPLQKPRAPARWKEIRKPPLSRGRRQPTPHLKGTSYQFHFFFPSWCLPNEMMLELKINRWVAG